MVVVVFISDLCPWPMQTVLTRLPRLLVTDIDLTLVDKFHIQQFRVYSVFEPNFNIIEICTTCNRTQQLREEIDPLRILNYCSSVGGNGFYFSSSIADQHHVTFGKFT